MCVPLMTGPGSAGTVSTASPICWCVDGVSGCDYSERVLCTFGVVHLLWSWNEDSLSPSSLQIRDGVSRCDQSSMDSTIRYVTTHRAQPSTHAFWHGTHADMHTLCPFTRESAINLHPPNKHVLALKGGILKASTVAWKLFNLVLL